MFHAQIGINNKTVLNFFLNDQFGNSEQNSRKLPIREQYDPFTVGNSEENSPNFSIREQYVPFIAGNSEQISPKLPI